MTGSNIREATPIKVVPLADDPLSTTSVAPSGLDGCDPLSLIARGEAQPGPSIPTFGRERLVSKAY